MTIIFSSLSGPCIKIISSYFSNMKLRDIVWLFFFQPHDEFYTLLQLKTGNNVTSGHQIKLPKAQSAQAELKKRMLQIE